MVFKTSHWIVYVLQQRLNTATYAKFPTENSASTMAADDQLVPLSEQELTKLASLAIEAKQKAYCKHNPLEDQILISLS